jgi:prepilin-type N-terminal cleavage/methylation domain-containing protein
VWQASFYRPAHTGRDRTDDAGFSLVEVLVALGLVTVVGASAAVFHMSSLTTARRQAHQQVAVQLVSSAVDQARKAGGAAVLASPPQPTTVQRNGIAFTVESTVAACQASVIPGDCILVAPSSSTAQLARLLVMVRWTDAAVQQREHAAVLLSVATTEPIFPS